MLDNVSIVMTNYNKGELIKRAYLSICNQLKEGDQIVIVDDFSSSLIDREIITNLVSEKKVFLSTIILNKKNKGVSFSKNRGVDAAINDIIILLDADDTLPENAVYNIKKGFYNSNIGVLFGDYNLINEDIKSNERVCCSIISNEKKSLDPSKLAKNWILLGSSPFRKSICFRDFKFNINFNRTDDVDFHRQLIINDIEFKYLNKEIYNWHYSPGGNNDQIPLTNILYSHAIGYKFFYDNLSSIDYLLFMSKFIFRLSVVSVNKIFKLNK